MALDSYKNAGFGTLSTGIDASATSISLTAGHGARFPAPTGSVQPFNAIIWNATTYTNPLDDPNYEIVRCTARSTDTLTVTRGQEGTTGVTHNTAAMTYKIALPLTLLGIQKLASGLGDYAGTDTGAADAYVTTIDTYVGAITAGSTVSFIAANTNTGASTLNHNGFGAVAIRDKDGAALIAGMITAGNLIKVQYEGTYWRMLTGTKGSYAITLSSGLKATFSDTQVFYFGCSGDESTVDADQRIYIPKTGTIKACEIFGLFGTNGSNESWTMAIRLNATTDTTVQAITVSASTRRWTNTALSIAVTAGDYIEIKSTSPTWATNPANGYFSGTVYIETAL